MSIRTAADNCPIYINYMVYEYNLILLCLKIGNVSDVKKYCPLGYHYILKIRTTPKEKSRYLETKGPIS